MKKYSVAIHANRLKQMLKRENSINCCPAGSNFSDITIAKWASTKEEICSTCLNFVNINPTLGDVTCPCSFLGKENAIEL